MNGAADELCHLDPVARPSAGPALRYRLSPDWILQEHMIRAGWKPEAHPHFTGRSFVFTAFEQFVRTCRQQGHGGVFVVEGPGGIGKTALLTEWVGGGGPHPAFFYRRQEGRTRVSAMPEALFGAVAQRYRPDRTLPDREERYADELAQLLKWVAKDHPSETDLLLFVDGLDEADDPEKAVQALPRPPLPVGVYLVVASRPRLGDADHLARCEGNEVVGSSSCRARMRPTCMT